jgi:hypothetical protein
MEDRMMKKLWTLLTAMLLAVVFSGLTACQEEEPATPGAALEKAAAEHPDAKVPKDHPAH